MIISRKQNDVLLTKKYLRKEFSVFDLAIPESQEKPIIEQVLLYTSSFVIVIHPDFQTEFNAITKIKCDLNSITQVMDGIFNNGTICNNLLLQEKKIIHLLMIKPTHPELVSDYILLFEKNFMFHYLLYVCKLYKLYDFYFYNGQAVVRLCNLQLRKSQWDKLEFYEKGLSLLRDNHLLYHTFEGIGDSFRFGSLWIGYAKQLLSKKVNPYLAIVKHHPGGELIKRIFSEFNFVEFDNSIQRAFCMNSCVCKNFLNLTERFECYLEEVDHKPKRTNYEILTWLLDLPIPDSPYMYKTTMQSRLAEALPTSEKDYIDALLYNKVYIGLQYFSGAALNLEKSDWASAIFKNWSKENVEQFLKVASQKFPKHNILLMNEDPYNLDFCMKNVKQLKPITVFGYAYAVSKLSALVGIESSGGHIASFYNVPSITLWGGGTSPFFFAGSEYSYRVYRKNISIIPVSGDVNQIDGDCVINALESIQNVTMKSDDLFYPYLSRENILYINT